MAALTLAIPSKGRLKDDCNAYFADAGAVLKQAAGGRGYRATLGGFPDIEVLLLSAGEIADSLIAGDVHLGITGEDLLREAAPELQGRIHFVRPLGFGFANVVVAVPQYWIDVSTMADLDDVCAAFAHRHRRRLRIATKYTQLTRSFFARVGISDYRIVESAGATEGAPAAGTAEAIVDITTTGATLAANGLKTLEDGTMLESQAQLAASLAAEWDGAARAACESLLARLNARARAKTSQILRVRLNGQAEKLLESLSRTAGATVLSRPTDAGGEYALLVPRAQLMDAIKTLRAQGCDAPATTQDTDYVFDTANSLYEVLAKHLPRPSTSSG
ncbi:MAG TPA: ATP phosphoribosyltransferase [Rhizomicrobium sp.]|jgi:ATP phosphoribosyltransferase|nr:ATP phosphoribosyltransferase [Rhizomicrobium sp.]